MSTKNELIDVIESARANGTSVKAIRKQKHAPADFYMTLTDGKQVGPVKCEGDIDELNRKFGEAVSYLNGMKHLKSGITKDGRDGRDAGIVKAGIAKDGNDGRTGRDGKGIVKAGRDA